jgi:hypothetical protein
MKPRMESSGPQKPYLASCCWSTAAHCMPIIASMAMMVRAVET